MAAKPREAEPMEAEPTQSPNQLKQAAGRKTRRPGVGMMHVQQETLHGKRQWKLSRRNLRVNQLPQHQESRCR